MTVTHRRSQKGQTMKVVEFERRGKFDGAHIYPFLQPDATEQPPNECAVIVHKKRLSDRCSVTIAYPRDMTHLEVLTLTKALKLAAKLAQVYTDVP